MAGEEKLLFSRLLKKLFLDSLSDKKSLIPTLLKGNNIRKVSMDLLISIECHRCGCCYKQNFSEMPHGKVLKCPFCSGTNIALNDEPLREDTGFETREGRSQKVLKSAR